jgi:hypothetical protein
VYSPLKPGPGPFHRPVAAPKSDLYLSLSAEERHFVDTIRDMGFSEADVARAVRKLGVDDRLVIYCFCSQNLIIWDIHFYSVGDSCS